MAIQRLSFSGHEPEDPICAEEPLNLLVTLNASDIPPLTVMLASRCTPIQESRSTCICSTLP